MRLPGFSLPILIGLAAATAAAPAAAQVKVEQIKVHGAALEGNLEGNGADRDVFVVLPTRYGKDASKRYPVVYFLHGFFSKAERYMDAAKVVDAANAAEAAGHEMIIVLPDSYTRHAGSMYSSSPTTGDFETFVARDLVNYIDAHYRTIARRESRGLSGHSMGGYGTLKIGMKYPQVFSSLYAMSACCITPRTTTLEQAKAMDGLTLEQAQKAEFGVRAGLASAAAWSPAPEKAPFFFDSGVKDGKLDPTVLAKWAANAPLAMVPQYLPALRSMTAIALDVGDKDFLLGDDTAIHSELDRFGIRHGWQVYDGDHVNKVAPQFQTKVLPFFAQHLKAK
ncbi:MAG: putative esterase [Sphingomonas bacterium]|nr:putative esterase [Sphingomonas bacterium]